MTHSTMDHLRRAEDFAGRDCAALDSNSASFLRAAFRSAGAPPTYADPHFGVRCVRSVEGTR